MKSGRRKSVANGRVFLMLSVKFTLTKLLVSVFYIQSLISYQGIYKFLFFFCIRNVLLTHDSHSFIFCVWFFIFSHRYFPSIDKLIHKTDFYFYRAAQSQCLGGLLTFFSAQYSNREQQQWAIWYAVGLISCAFVSTAFTNPFLIHAYQMGMQIRVICTSLIYRKVIQAHTRRREWFVIRLRKNQFFLINRTNRYHNTGFYQVSIISEKKKMSIQNDF